MQPNSKKKELDFGDCKLFFFDKKVAFTNSHILDLFKAIDQERSLVLNSHHKSNSEEKELIIATFIEYLDSIYYSYQNYTKIKGET